MLAGGIIAAIAVAFVIGWFRVGAGADGDLTDEQIIARGDQRLADIIQGEAR